MVMQLQAWTQDSLQHSNASNGKVDWDAEDTKMMGNRYSLLKEQMTLGVVDLQPSSSQYIMLLGSLFSSLFIYTLSLCS